MAPLTNVLYRHHVRFRPRCCAFGLVLVDVHLIFVGLALTFSVRLSSVVFKAVESFGTFETSATVARAISAFQYLDIQN